MKNLIFREGHQKPIYRGPLPKKEEAWQKKRVVGVGVGSIDTPMNTMVLSPNETFIFLKSLSLKTC